jgi:hypothetical protein
MPRNSSGTATRVSPPGAGGYISGDVISPAQVNGELNDVYIELTNSIDKAGRTTPTANLKMGGKRHTGCGNAVDTTDYCTLGQAQTLVAGIIPSGTKMPFYQASPPAGWTAASVTNDSMMRVVTAATTGGTGGGSMSPILITAVPSHTHTVSGDTGNQSADHTHGYNHVGSGTHQIDGLDVASLLYQKDVPFQTGNTSNDHHHYFTATSAENSGAADITPRYADFCIGTKT